MQTIVFMMDPSSAWQPRWVGVGWDALEIGDERRRVEGGGCSRARVCVWVRGREIEGWGVGWRRERGREREKKKRQNPSSLWRRSVWSRGALLSGPVSAETTLVAASTVHTTSGAARAVTVRRGASRAPRCSSSAPRCLSCPTYQWTVSTLCSKRRGEDPRRWIRGRGRKGEGKRKKKKRKKERGEKKTELAV